MKSVFAAVLLDNEARSPAGLATRLRPLREPMLRFVQWARTFGAVSTTGNWKIGDLSQPNSQLGQSPLRSPSVFNFFRPGYVPPSTAIASAKMVAPEFQVVNETSVGGYLNYMQDALPRNTKDVNSTYAGELALVLDPAGLVRRLNLLLTGNQLSDATQALIANALGTPAVTASSTDAVKLNRVLCRRADGDGFALLPDPEIRDRAMYLIDPAAHTRRAFLRRSGQLAMAGTALPFALNLAAMGEAAAQAAPGDDYKALVCVFLFGGNDYANTVITYDDPSYNAYSAVRVPQASGGIAIAKNDMDVAKTLLAPTTPLAGARQYALHPAMTQLADLFNVDGKAAVQLNVGPLVVPLNRAQYNNSNKKLYPQPPKLFSHNDQQSTWQSSSPEGSTVGWGGNLGDLALSQNTNSLFTCMSVAGNAVFLSGDQALQYQVSTSGAVGINSVKGTRGFVSASVRSAMGQLVQEARSHVLENEYNRVTKRAVEAETTVTGALASPLPVDSFGALNTNLLAAS